VAQGRVVMRGRGWGRWVGAAVLLAGLAIVGWLAWGAWRASILWARAEAAVRDRRWNEAETALASLSWYRPRDPEVLRRRVEVNRQRGDLDTAIRVLADVPESDPQIERARMTRGLLLMERFRYREAEAQFRDCLRHAPSPAAEAEARIQLIILTGLKRKYRAFEDELWAYYERCGHPISALRMLARGQAMLPDRATMDRALDEGYLLLRGLEADPGDPGLRPPLARYLIEQNRVVEARALLDSWLETHPDDAAARVEWLACRQGDIDGCRPWFESPTGAFESLARYWLLRGEWLLQQRRFAEAAESFGRAVALEPRDPHPRFRRGQALHRAGQADAAAADLAWLQRSNQLKVLLLQRIRDDNLDPDLLAQAGQLCLAMDRPREARAWLEEALRRDPDHAEARRVLDEFPP
jgi:tetratricopeptide (TPR) repeat protein